MYYKRSEGFRFDFQNPLSANFKILVNGIADQMNENYYSCEILDVSPRGMKMFSNANFGEHTNNMLQFEIHFILDEVSIHAVGDIVWERTYANGKQYGLIFNNQPNLEALIVTELKARRKKEVLIKSK